MMTRYFQIIQTLLLFLSCCFFYGCSSLPFLKPLTKEEQVEVDHSIGIQLIASFEKMVKIKRDPKLSAYLESLARALANGMDILRDSPVDIFVIEDQDNDWKNFSLPGNRIYLSLGLLRLIKFENELASVLSMELGHLAKKNVLNQIYEMSHPRIENPKEKPPELNIPRPGEETDKKMPEWKITLEDFMTVRDSIVYLGEKGIFTFNQKAHLDALEVGIELLYYAGFDSRGMVSLWYYYKNNPRSSLYDPETLAKLLDKTRHLISLYAPLRNPIVKSTAFVEMQKRIQYL